ncbi:MAG: LamG-like jellyroll fold domain-containing protein, partial [Oscillospiraceae bacterium]
MFVAGLCDSKGKYIATLEYVWNSVVLHWIDPSGTNASAEIWGSSIAKGQWAHVAATYAPDGKVSLFINGVQQEAMKGTAVKP